MRGKRVVLGVCGGIAAYKSAYLASALTREGATVSTVLTPAAERFIQPLTFQALTREAVYTGLFDERDPGRIAHIGLADDADLVVVAPATADFLARAAHGLGDDMLTAVLLATRAPVVIAPAMNVHMWENQIVRRNVQTLRDAGYHVAEPGEGPLACGYTGKGRLMEPEDILEYLHMVLTPKHLSGRSVLVTAGPTHERLDPVRFLTNDSSGTMGFALAQAAWRMGARVTLLSGPVARPVPLGVTQVRVESAQEMRAAALGLAPAHDWIVMAAAVSDYRPLRSSERKIKKDADLWTLELARNPDIVTELCASRTPGQVVAGFAAETDHVAENAQAKLRKKGLDVIAANDVTEVGAGFGEGTNRVTLYFADGRVEESQKADKLAVAEWMLRQIASPGPDRVRPDGPSGGGT